MATTLALAVSLFVSQANVQAPQMQTGPAVQEPAQAQSGVGGAGAAGVAAQGQTGAAAGTPGVGGTTTPSQGQTDSSAAATGAQLPPGFGGTIPTQTGAGAGATSTTGTEGEPAAEAPTPEQQISQLQTQMRAQLEAMQTSNAQTAEQLQAAQEQIAAMTAELEVLRQRAAQEVQARQALEADSQSLQSMGAYLEQADFLLVAGSDEATAVVTAARNELASRLGGVAPTGRSADLLNYLDAALVALENGDNNNARGRVWQAMTALLDSAATVNIDRRAP